MLLVARHDPAEDNAKAAHALWDQVGVWVGRVCMQASHISYMQM
jgi:hypothetical protein